MNSESASRDHDRTHRPRPTLRVARPEDTPHIIDLIARVYAEYGLICEPDGFDRDLRDPRGHCRAHGGEFWVAEEAGRIIATVGVTIDGTGGELKRLYVDTPARGQGLGRWLTEHAIGHARRAGCTCFIAWSDTLFTHAHALYRSMGFVQQGRRQLEDLNQSWEYGFVLTLDTDAPPT